MKLAELYRQARELLSDPAHWCKEHYAVAYEGDGTDATCPFAVRWCLLGSIHKVLGTLPKPIHLDLLHEQLLRYSPKHRSVATFNDDPNTTHQQVLEFLDGVIAEAERGDV